MNDNQLEVLQFPLLSETPELDIDNNDGAFQMDFPNLTSTSLRIDHNPDLLTLGDFSSFPQKDVVFVTENPSLPQCEAEALLLPDGYCFCFGNDETASCE